MEEKNLKEKITSRIRELKEYQLRIEKKLYAIQAVIGELKSLLTYTSQESNE